MKASYFMPDAEKQQLLEGPLLGQLATSDAHSLQTLAEIYSSSVHLPGKRLKIVETLFSFEDFCSADP